MAKYTVELGELVEKHEVDIFDFDYPFYSEAERKPFEQKFINHFYFREIGSETVSRFKHNLKSTFETKFPLYNRMFEIKQMDYNILKNYELTETYSMTKTGTQQIEGTTEQTTLRDNSITANENRTKDEAGSTETLSHDTGAGMKPSDLANYATKVEKVTSNADTTDTADTTTTENEELGVTGTNTNIGETSETESYSKTTAGDVGVATQMKALLEEVEYRKVMERIELDFFKEVDDLFMQIF